MARRDLAARLRRRAARAGAHPDGTQIQQLEAYFGLLQRWNRKINLTGLDLDWDEAIDRLVVEPLVAAREIPHDDRKLIDIGSGGGSPAIPLRILCPALQVTMVEAKTRKAVFLREVVRELQLESVWVETSRYEQLLTRPDFLEGFDTLTVRAVRVESRTLLTLQAFVRPGGRLLLFRSSRATTAAVPPPLQLLHARPLVEETSSHLLVLGK